MANQSNAEVVVKLPSIDELLVSIGTPKLKIIMSEASTVVAGEVRKRWARGVGASNINMEAEQPISKRWKFQKGMAGRKPIINYSYYGDFAQSFIPRKISEDGREVTIAFGGMSKGIKYISHERVAGAIKEGGGVQKTVSRVRSLGGGSTKSVENTKKARGLAYWRPKSFQPDDTLELVGVKAFLQSLKSLVKFSK